MSIEAQRDTNRMDWLELMAAHAKWEDFCPGLRPVDESGEYQAKYVGEHGYTIRAAIDAQIKQNVEGLPL